jgi:hypothetical protein
MIWVRSEDWGNVNYSTIFGNMYNGGYALRFNNLKYTPYFFIAEKTYNNVICFNQNLKPYLTSNLFANYLSNITTYTVDGNRDLIVLDNVLKKIYKLDHLCSSKNLIFDFAEEVEDVNSLNLYYVYANRYNNYYVTTSNGVYEIDNELLTCTNINRECNQYTRIAFGFDKRMAVVQDARCAHYTKNNILLSVDLRGNLIINNDVAKNAYEYPNIVSFNIDPEGYVWLMFGVNVIAKVIIKDKTIEKVVSYIIGGVNYRKSVDIRHITFIHRQTRTGTREWYAVSYSNIDKFVHYFTKDLVEIDADNIQWLTGVIDVSQSDVIISCDPCALDVDAPQEAAMTLCDSTDISGYNWSRVNDYILYDDIEQLQFKVSLKNIKTKSFKIFTMGVPRTLLYNQYWQHISVMFNGEVFTLFIDGVAHTTMEMPSGYFINYSTCHSTYIGTTTGKFKSLNDEIKITQLNFNASVDDLRIYNYQIDQNLLLLFRRAYFYGKDMLWNIPTAPIQYIDGIERLFQHKIPGSVSNFYKLKVKNFKLNTNNQEDEQEIKDIIEEVLTENVSKVQPAHTELLSVEWD